MKNIITILLIILVSACSDEDIKSYYQEGLLEINKCDFIENKSSIYLSFDDYYPNWSIINDKYRDKPVEFTFFVNSGWDSLMQDLVDNGHSIGNHTRSHLNLAQTKLNWVDVLEDEVVSLNDELKEHTEVKAFAFPFGAFNTFWTAVLVEHFSHVRRFGTTDNKPKFYKNPTMDGQVVITSSSLDNIKFESDSDFYNYIDDIVYYLSENGGSVSLTTHDISDSDWAIKEERLDYLVNLALDNCVSLKSI